MRSESTNATHCPQDLEQNIQVLTHTLQGIAGSIDMAPAFVDVPQFFYDYMVGFQTAFHMILLGIMGPDLLMAKFQATAGS